MVALRVYGGSESSLKPTIPGFSPDPSICVIDGVFFLATSSFHLYPGLPIYVSHDLNSWELLGHAIHRPDQLSLRHSDTELPTPTSATIATGGLWAPTIRHHEGSTYIICTNVVYRKGRTDSSRQNFIIHTTDILSGQWSDPLYFDFDGIDPSIFFDDDGKAYVQICAHPKGGIWQFQIDIKTAQPLTAPSLLWEGWDRRFTEGPHVYKKDGYYYLLVAEGGTFEEHMISVARSKSIHGPFDPCPNNPLLTAAGTNNYLHHTGHGDLFQDANGYWYTVVLAVRRTGSRFPLGRETFLARVSWPKNEWPRIHEPSICHLAAAQGGSALHFENKNNSLIHLRDADVSKYTVSDGGVVISASAADLASHKDTLSFAGRRQIHLVGTSCVALVTPSVTLASGALKAGISLYKDEHRFAALGYDFGKGQMYFEARNRASGFSVEATMAVPTKDRAYLCIEYTELEWAFQYRIGKCDEWVRLGVVDTGLLSGRDFTGPIIGMFAVGQGEAQNREVRFEEVEL